MTKNDITGIISNNLNMDKTSVQKVIEDFMATIKQTLSEGNKVQIRGFGKFFMKKRKEKLGRNISKNTSMIIPESYIPSFKPGKDFLEMVKKVNISSKH